MKLVHLSLDKEQIHLPIRIHKKCSSKTSDAERRSRILALKSSQASIRWKKEKRILAFPYKKSFVCSTLTKPHKDLNYIRSNVYWWKYLQIFTTSTSVCTGRISGAVCEHVCIVRAKKEKHTQLKFHIFPLLILTPSEFMLELPAYEPVTSHSSSSSFNANSKLPISISDVYPGKLKRMKFSFKARRGKK